VTQASYPWRLGARVVAGARQYGLAFAIEVLLFDLTLVIFQTLGYSGPPASIHILPLGLLLVAIAMGAAEARLRLYHRVWEVAGLEDAVAIALAVTEASLLLTIANGLTPPEVRPFRFVTPILFAPAVAAVIGVYRLLPRLLSRAPRADNRLLIVLSGSNAYSTVKALIQNPNPLWSPVAIVTTDPTDVHRRVMGIPVVGSADDLEHWAERTKADGVAFMTEGGDRSAFKELFAICVRAELPIFVLPGAEDWFRARRSDHLRPLSADDLLARSQTPLEDELPTDVVSRQTVLVTGAAGSIGSELCRQLGRLRPDRLVLIDNNESGLFDITEELRVGYGIDVREVLLSVTDYDGMQAIFTDERPDLVFHAAAYKHVPMLEDHPEQAFMVNVIGTHNALRCADSVGVQRFVLISTDKAVARESVMGCSKRLCELITLSYKGDMSCWPVRFGNVVGSRGSVVPLFERQIESGGPVTITHPDMERYMMTIKEAVSLVVGTLTIGKSGHLYMLDMGAPVKILSLAQSLIRARGLRPGADIEILFSGPRPGERLTEELLSPDEESGATSNAGIFEVVSSNKVDADGLAWKIERLRELAVTRQREELVRGLRAAVAQPKGGSRRRSAAEGPGEGASPIRTT
jgi:FlaA1/EpsC-like NDP-sugar epimerase